MLHDKKNGWVDQVLDGHRNQTEADKLMNKPCLLRGVQITVGHVADSLISLTHRPSFHLLWRSSMLQITDTDMYSHDALALLKLTSRNNIQKKGKLLHDSCAWGCLRVRSRQTTGLSARLRLSYDPAFVWTHVCERVCLRTSVSSSSSFSPPPPPPPGCLRDVRLNGHPLPLEKEKPSKGLQVVSSQGVSVGCSSDACRKQHCAPPLVCVDLWRHQECRCSKQTEHTSKHLKTGRGAPTRSAHICRNASMEQCRRF